MKPLKYKTLLITIGTVLTLVVTGLNYRIGFTAQQQPKAFLPISQSEISSLPKLEPDTNAGLLRSRYAKVNSSFFKKNLNLQKGDSITLEIFDNAIVEIIIDSIAYQRDSIYSWSGTPRSPYFGTAEISTSRQSVFGIIQIHTTIFQIIPETETIVRINEIDQSKLPRDGEPLKKVFKKTKQFKRQKFPTLKQQTNARPQLRVLVILPKITYPAVCKKGELFGMDLLNLFEVAYENNLNKTFNAVRATGLKANVICECYDYNPIGGNLSADLQWVSTNENIAILRNSKKADLVSLIVPESIICGRAFVNYPMDADLEDRGFSVVKASCALSNYSFAHELGHNFGMQHDRQATGNFSSNACNFGFVFPVTLISPIAIRTNARDIMAYGSSCNGCPRFGLFSNPMTINESIVRIGPMGRNCSSSKLFGLYLRANNRQQLIDAFPTVSNFRE